MPSLLQRLRILKCVCGEMPLRPDVDLKAVAEMSCGYVGADLSALGREAALQAMRQAQVRSPRWQTSLVSALAQTWLCCSGRSE